MLPELQIRASILNLSLQVLDSSGSSEPVVGAYSESKVLLIYCLLNYACMHVSTLVCTFHLHFKIEVTTVALPRPV